MPEYRFIEYTEELGRALMRLMSTTQKTEQDGDSVAEEKGQTLMPPPQQEAPEQQEIDTSPKGEWDVKIENGMVVVYNSLSPSATEGHITVDRQYEIPYASFAVVSGSVRRLYIRVTWDDTTSKYVCTLNFGSSVTGTWTYELARVNASGVLTKYHTPGNVIAVTGRYV